jgi:hypothetical protein
MPLDIYSKGDCSQKVLACRKGAEHSEHKD